MGDIICRKCGAINPPITTESFKRVRKKDDSSKYIIKRIRKITKETRCAYCGGEIDWIMT